MLALDGTLIGAGSFICAKTKGLGQWPRFHAGLIHVASQGQGLAAVAVENPFSGRGKQDGNERGGRQARAGRVAWGARAIIELWAERRDVEVVGYAPSTIKKHAAGSGRATKPQVAAAMVKLYPELAGEEFDTTDAVAVGVTCLARCDLDELACGHVVERAR